MEVDISNESTEHIIIRCFINSYKNIKLNYVDGFVLNDNGKYMRLFESEIKEEWRNQIQEWCLQNANTCLERINKQIELWGTSYKDVQGEWE